MLTRFPTASQVTSQLHEQQALWGKKGTNLKATGLPPPSTPYLTPLEQDQLTKLEERAGALV